MGLIWMYFLLLFLPISTGGGPNVAPEVVSLPRTQRGLPRLGPSVQVRGGGTTRGGHAGVRGLREWTDGVWMDGLPNRDGLPGGGGLPGGWPGAGCVGRTPHEVSSIHQKPCFSSEGAA